jgi:hypothetical protein
VVVDHDTITSTTPPGSSSLSGTLPGSGEIVSRAVDAAGLDVDARVAPDARPPTLNDACHQQKVSHISGGANTPRRSQFDSTTVANTDATSDSPPPCLVMCSAVQTARGNLDDQVGSDILDCVTFKRDCGFDVSRKHGYTELIDACEAAKAFFISSS